MSSYEKPLPTPSRTSKPYWDYCKRHELRIQRCTQCGRYRHYPQEMCPYCNSLDAEWTKVSGKGKVYTWVVCHQAFHPGFAADVPYAVVNIELDEGIRMMSRVIDVKPEELEIGMPVHVVFEDVSEDFALPVFRKGENRSIDKESGMHTGSPVLFAFTIFFSLGVIGWGGSANAQAWPSQTARIVVPFAAGGGTDVLTRMLSKKFSESVGPYFIVENRVGAGGNIGSASVARAAKDGYTLLLTTSTLAINASLSKNLTFDPVKDLQPISQIMSSPLLLCLHPSVPARSVKELVDLARKRKEGLNAASSSTGSTSHISIEMMQQMMDVKLTHIPYNGSGPSTIAVLSGEVDLLFATAIVAKPQVSTGKFRCLAVTTPKRSSAFPDLPTLDSQYPGFEMDLWYAIFFPAGTARELLTKMNSEVKKALNSSDLRDAIIRQGGEPAATTPEEMATYFKRDVEKYAKIIKAANIQAN